MSKKGKGSRPWYVVSCQVGEDDLSIEMLSRDPAYSVSHLGTGSTAIMMQCT